MEWRKPKGLSEETGVRKLIRPNSPLVPPLSGTDDYIKRDGESVDVQIRAVLPAAPTKSNLYAANGLNIAIGKQVADSKTGVVATRTDKAVFPSAKISNLTYTIHIAIAVFDFCKELFI